jgi:hypothetical protein
MQSFWDRSLYLKVFINAVLGALTAQTRLLHTSKRRNLQNAQPHLDSEHCLHWFLLLSGCFKTTNLLISHITQQNSLVPIDVSGIP